MQETLEYVP